jgi:GNAT superfamily N-acetyltransferase
MLIKNYYDINSDEREKFLQFLLKASMELKQPAHSNMTLDGENNTLLYILDNSDRFKNGQFNILFHNENIIACSGCYVSSFSDDVLIAGSRTWIDKEYRNKNISREYLLPFERRWAIDNNLKCMALTFNDYNKNLINMWFRKGFGERRPNRKDYHFGFKGLHTLEFAVNIQYTKQYVLYENLDDSFSYDWNQLKYTDES